MNHLSQTVKSNDNCEAHASLPPSPVSAHYITRGSVQFMYVTYAMCIVGLATFALVYCVQPILPILSQQFGISPAESSVALSVSTSMMALGLLITGILSDRIGRKSVMVIALLLAAICTMLCAIMNSWNGILIMRALIGLSLSGVAAVGMSYLSEEIHPSVLAFSMGLYVSGNSIGGMSGRLITGVITDFFSWRVAIMSVGIFSLAAALIFWKILPASRHFQPASLKPRNLLINFRLHWRDANLPLLFIEGFLLMGAFVTLFNYIGYRLLAEPWFLNPSMLGLLSVVYLTGSWSSPKAGAMTTRFDRGAVLLVSTAIMLIGSLLTLFNVMWVILVGMMLFTAGFFAAHATASGWVGACARRARGQASSLYLCFYYAGSSIAGTLGGILWHHLRWSGIISFIGLLLVAALAAGYQLKKCQ